MASSDSLRALVQMANAVVSGLRAVVMYAVE
jgi:hypothetical protein